MSEKFHFKGLRKKFRKLLRSFDNSRKVQGTARSLKNIHKVLKIIREFLKIQEKTENLEKLRKN